VGHDSQQELKVGRTGLSDADRSRFESGRSPSLSTFHISGAEVEHMVVAGKMGGVTGFTSSCQVQLSIV
jgi:hypothetical protein